MENQITYAAYGTNISVAQMAVRFPDARVYGRAELRDHELVFRGPSGSAVATVEPREGGAVPVLLWSSPGGTGWALDIYENWPVLRPKGVLEVPNEQQGPSTPRSYIMTPVPRLGRRPPSTTATFSRRATHLRLQSCGAGGGGWHAVRQMEHEHHLVRRIGRPGVFES